jgi:hypothetical protein
LRRSWKCKTMIKVVNLCKLTNLVLLDNLKYLNAFVDSHL